MGKRSQSAAAKDLEQLAKATPSVRQVRSDHIPKASIQLLCDCSRAILKGHLGLTPPQMRSLRANKKDLRKLASAETSIASKRAIVKKGVLVKKLTENAQPAEKQEKKREN